MRLLTGALDCWAIACGLLVVSCHSGSSLQPHKQFIFEAPGGRGTQVSQLSLPQQRRVAAATPTLRRATSGMTRSKVMEILKPVECFPGAENGGLRYEDFYLASDLRVPLIFVAKATTPSRDADILWSGVKEVEVLSNGHWQTVRLSAFP